MPRASAKPSRRSGILPIQEIRALVVSGAIDAERAFEPSQIQPASLDLRLDGVAYRVRASFLPGGPDGRAGVMARIKDLSLHKIDLSASAVLETGCVYVVPLQERLALPADIAAAANPKSSTGRRDVFTGVIADGVTSFDTIPAGYSGQLYAEICPQTFPIVVRRGSMLSQIRFRAGDPVETDDALEALHKKVTLVRGGATADVRGGIALSVDLVGDGKGLVGYRARRHTGLVDVDAPGACALADYWEPIVVGDRRRLILDPDQFYILASTPATTCATCSSAARARSASSPRQRWRCTRGRRPR
jgi:dCTP deaminase